MFVFSVVDSVEQLNQTPGSVFLHPKAQSLVLVWGE